MRYAQFLYHRREGAVLTSRQRLLSALDHREPDRPPIDFGATRVTGVHAALYNRLTRRLELPSAGARVYDVPQMLAWPEDPVREYFQTDAVLLPRLVPAPAIGLRVDRFREESLVDGSPAFFPHDYRPERDAEGNLTLFNAEGKPFFRMPADGWYFSRLLCPLAGAQSRQDINAFDLHEFAEGESEWLRMQAETLSRSGKAVVGQFGGNFLERGNRLFGMENFLVKLLLEPALVHYFFERVVEASIEDFDRYREAVGDRVDVIQLNDDLGSQDGPLVSEELYCRMIKPYQRRLYEHIRTHSDMRLFLHSCGSIAEFIPHLIEIGVQILNPVQYRARDMDPERLKSEFGRDLVFWGGGCDTQEVLARGTEEEVRRETRRMMDIFAPGGGFVFAPVHNLQPNVPLENVLATYQTAREAA
jgi:uroporphyrinogen decarboxylase